MIPFLPNSPATVAGALALFAVLAFAFWRDRRAWPLVLVMVLNWCATRAVSSFELSGLVQATADISAAVLLIALRHAGNMAVLPVAALYALMVFIAGAHDLGVITRDTMWAWADVLGYLQLLIIAGGAAGGGRARLAMGGDRPRRTHRAAILAANRLQARPPA